jgi:O-antigen/teichoic acid export membrane protein
VESSLNRLVTTSEVGPPPEAEVDDLGFTPARFRFWGIRSGISILDQGLTSGAGFVLNLLLARWLGNDAYGAFAVAFSTLLFLSGFHNVLLLEPLSVFGPANYSQNLKSYFAAQVRIHCLLVAALSVSLLVAGMALSRAGFSRDLAAATSASAVAVPPLLFFWLVRRMCYAISQPVLAAWASGAYLLLTAIGLVVMQWTHTLGPGKVFFLIGAASMLASMIPLRWIFNGQGILSARCSWRVVAAENWSYGRWLVASTTLFTAANQAQTYVAAALLGLGAAGILRAMQVPSLIMTQVVIAVGLLMLPSMSSDFGRAQYLKMRKKAVLVSSCLAGLAIVCAVFLGVFAKTTAQTLYGSKFAENAYLIPILALVPVCAGFSIGFSMALRASRKPQFDLLANAIATPVGIITAVGFTRSWGLAGAAVSLVVSFAVYALVFAFSFRFLNRPLNRQATT